MMTGNSTDQLIVARVAGPRPVLDPRQAIATSQVVDIALAGSVAAARYVRPASLVCRVPRTPMRARADAGAPAVSELLLGEGFDVFDTAGSWAFGRSTHDGYSGWVAESALAEGVPSAPKMVTVRVAPIFAEADIKSPVEAELPFGARVSGATEGSFLALATGGYLHVRHVSALPPTPLAVARRFAGAPYLWGGRTPQGVDCSGLVQAALAACGIAAPRDSDQQRRDIGREVDFADRRGGDLVFFPGHVGLLIDADTLFHANAFWMTTVEEPLADVIARGSAVLAVRRV